MTCAGSAWTDAPHGAAGNLIIQANEVRDSVSAEDESAYYNACTLDPNQGYSCVKMAGTLGTGQYSDAKACLFDTGSKGVCCMAKYDGSTTNGARRHIRGCRARWRRRRRRSMSIAGKGQRHGRADRSRLRRSVAPSDGHGGFHPGGPL